jgi:hypothetical protein
MYLENKCRDTFYGEPNRNVAMIAIFLRSHSAPMAGGSSLPAVMIKPFDFGQRILSKWIAMPALLNFEPDDVCLTSRSSSLCRLQSYFLPPSFLAGVFARRC